MTLLMPADEACKKAKNAKGSKKIMGQNIIDEEVADVKKRLAINKDNLLGLVNNEIDYASNEGRQKVVINRWTFEMYLGNIDYYQINATDILEHCIDKSGYEQRGEQLADEVVKRLTSKDLPLNERFRLTLNNRISNIYRLIAFLKQALTKAGYQVKYKKFSDHQAIVVRW